MAEPQQNQPKGKPPQPPDPLMKLKIAKKAYVFEVRKKYTATRNFNVKKKAETPAQDALETLLASFQKKKALPSEDKAAEQAKAEQALQKPAKPSSALSLALKISAALVLLFFLAIGYVFLQFGSPAPISPPQIAVSSFSGQYGYSMLDSRMLSSGEDGSSVAYFLMDTAAENLSSLNVTLGLFSEKPPLQVFVLDHARDSAYSYPIFRSKLGEKLPPLGLSVNDIDVDSLRSLPGGCILIIPTGYFPLELLEAGPGNYQSLLARGVSIIYVGYPFDSTALDGNGNAVKVSNKDFKFVPSRPGSSSGFQLYDAQYVVDGANLVYGSVSAVRRGPGAMLFLPQSLDSGWITDEGGEGAEKAANDIMRIASEQVWIAPFSSMSSNAYPRAIENQTVFTLFSSPIKADSAYVKLSADASDLNGIFQRTIEIYTIRRTQAGDMSVREERAVPYFLSGQKTRVNLRLREADPKPVKLFIAMYKDGEELQRSELEYGLTNPTLDKSIDFEVNAPPGSYVMLCIDNNGKVYAATKLDVIDLSVSIGKIDWNKGYFPFVLSSGGRAINPRGVTVTMDGKNPRSYSPSELKRVEGGSFLEYYSKDKVEDGVHTFTFSFDNYSASVGAEYSRSKYFWENPLVIVLGLVSLAVFGIGYVLRRTEAPRYGLDIPDFPPLSTIKIPVRQETVLEIFDNVNLGYSWKWMPLRTEELKAGFRKLTYNGKPILIGDFNLERILAKLREEGKVASELDYWGLSRWQKESGHSIRYLTLYRIMRNIFVNNAVKFSRLDSMEDCDVKAIVGKEELYLHIMEEPADRVVHRALATAKKGPTIIVFANQEEADAFGSSLTSTSKLAVALKMEMQNRNIFLMPVKLAINAYLKQITV